MAERRTHFLHVRKTGGSAVGHALAPVAESHRIVIHGHGVRLADVPPDDDVFFFLRHPVERYVSGFNSRFRHGRPLRDFSWTHGEERAFARFQSPNALAEALGSPDPELARDARFAMRNINHVSSSFSDWFTLDELVARRERIVLLGLQPSLEHDFAFIKRRLGIPDTVTLPADPVFAHRTPPSYETALSPAAHANVTAWYATDIDFYARYVRLREEWFGADGAGGPAPGTYMETT
jgi:sulfotransferase famil protein